jgi:hypothetical protein
MIRLGAMVCAAVVLLASVPVRASSHLWEITEVFSNADGSVQYIELSTTSAGQTALSGHTIVARANGVPTATFTFSGNLTGNTVDGHVLIATASFGTLPGAVTPDFILPCGFLPLDATVVGIDFVGSDQLTFADTALPRNGTDSLTATAGGILGTAPSSPRNFAGVTGALTGPVCCAPGCPDPIFADGFEVSAGP